MVSPEAVVTFERVDGFRVVRSFGPAYGVASRPRNMFRNTFRSIGSFIGLAPIEYLTDAERAREESLQDLREKADAIGANGVINLRFEATETSDGSTQVLSRGEAVLLEPCS
ncbi:MAG: heavy metal-binding domain-containing protein [Candidatus Eremiobacteraeota bacterium]|nr:heavy metal-binding domain-containing protein [Candidatus Eremiobacteraeota bacterium]